MHTVFLLAATFAPAADAEAEIRIALALSLSLRQPVYEWQSDSHPGWTPLHKDGALVGTYQRGSKRYYPLKRHEGSEPRKRVTG